MSSYYQSFSCVAPNGKRYNSYKDKNLVVVHFESGDSGEVDTFLGMEPIYTDNAYGTRRLDYGAKYNNVAVIRISVMKSNGKDFTVDEVRDFLRWTTGARTISYLDLSDIVEGEEIVKASFLGRVTSVYQQKLDARTVGFVIEHTSVSPYAYSPIQRIYCPFKQKLLIDENNTLLKDGSYLHIDYQGILNNNSDSVFDITNNGILYIDNSVHIQVNNNTDDLSSYVFMDAKFTNTNSDYLVIKNQTLYDESDGKDGLTELIGMHDGEVITLHSNQFITSDKGRQLGNDFNFIWPKLMPGSNHLVVSGTGSGVIDFSYRYPIKIGDCAINIEVNGSELYCDE